MPPYHASFPKGAQAQVASLDVLEKFRREWTRHDPILPEQLACADKIAVVKAIGYYHGGDVLYRLDELPGVWHECCLRNPSLAKV